MKKYSVMMGLLFFVMVSTSWGQILWQGTVGIPADWTDTANWTGGVVPTSYCYINNGGIADVSSGPVECDTIFAGRGGEGTLRVSSGGVLTNALIYTGFDSPGRLEIDGGEVLSYAKSLYVGYQSSGTGTVVMTGGTLNLKNYSVGYNGTGTFVLSNGVINTTEWQTFVGYKSGSYGTFIQNGGTNTYSGGACYVGRDSGSTGRYILNGGKLSAPNVSIGDTGNGYMEINGGTIDVPGVVFVGTYVGSTGKLVLNNTTNSIATLTMGSSWPHHGGEGTVIMNSGEITITGNNYIGARPECDSTFIQNGGVLNCKFMQLPDNEAANSTEGATGTFIARSNAVTVCDGDVALYNGGRFEVGGDANVSIKSFYVRGGDSYAEQSGGTLTSAGIFYLPDGTNSATFHMKGGVFRRTEVNNQSYQFYIGGKSADSGPGAFIQSGGVVTNDQGMYLARYSTNHVGRYEISGGILESSTRNLYIAKTRVAEFCVKGSTPVVNLRTISASTNEFSLEFIMDKSAEHIAAINFINDHAYRCGHLHIGFDGGVLLSKDNNFKLLSWNAATSTSYGDYVSTPDANMWTETFYTSNPAHDDITLADGYKMGDFDLDGTTSAQFAEHAMGHVTVKNISTNKLVNLVMRLAVTEKEKTLSELADDLVSAGYTNSVVETSGIYNLKVVIPVDYVVDSAEATTSYFAWDFTDTTTGTTNATVTAIEVLEDNLPVAGTLVIIN